MLPLINSTYFQEFVESFTNGVLIVNIGGESYVANTAAANILGFPRHECVSQSWQTLFADIEEREDVNRFMADASKNDRCPLPLHCRLKKNDGQLVYLNMTASTLSEGGKIFGIMVLINDMTGVHEMHRRETQILQERNALNRERLESLQNISKAIAHQIRNPMMTIGGLANLILKRSDAHCTCHSYLEGIVEASKRLENIVSAISAYRLMTVLNPVRTTIEELVLAAQGIALKKVWDEKRALAWMVDIEPHILTADKNLLTKAFTEILVNSMESLDNCGGHIKVSGKKSGAAYSLHFEDNGRGIEGSLLPYVTDPFFTTKAVGVGMGLCNVQRIIKEHSGLLDISSAPSQGTEVHIQLPLT